MSLAENPWLSIPLADYEGHMETVGQTGALRSRRSMELPSGKVLVHSLFEATGNAQPPVAPTAH